jgi:glycogen debranching enzyme
MTEIRFGRQLCGSLAEATSREWLVADGLGGYAMGTVSRLRTRRYHGLLVVATQPPARRMLALAALDPVLVVGDRTVRLASHAWASGVIAPTGHVHQASFSLRDGVPTWRWAVGDVVVEAEVAMVRGRPAVAVVHRVVRAPGPVRLELEALSTWRDAHGERWATGEPAMEVTADGFTFEGAYRVAGPGFEPGGVWYTGVRYAAEAERGLNDREDLWYAGRFTAEIEPGGVLDVRAWAGELAAEPPPAVAVVAEARERARQVAEQAKPDDDTDRLLAVAADQFVVEGPTVVAGYPWFGDWSRDTLTSYEGLFLETNRWDAGRALLERLAASVSRGMLANTADAGSGEDQARAAGSGDDQARAAGSGDEQYNTVDAAMWFLHAVDRHVAVTGDLDLAAAVVPTLESIVDHHLAGTRFGIVVDHADGLVTQGERGWALTWMDARVDGVPVTARAGKPVEVNALWVSGLAALAGLQERVGRDPSSVRSLHETARQSFRARFPRPGGGLHDVIDGPAGDDPAVRPNQLLAASLPRAPLASAGEAAGVLAACAQLLTSVGLRSLSPADPAYVARHRGGPAERDRAYHQGTVWPWLIGPYVDCALRAGVTDPGLLLDGLIDHLGEWGMGSVSETADADPPHAATGCPFQAWSVAELFRARRAVTRR